MASNAPQTEAIAPSLEAGADNSGVWRVGTLTYTGTGLVMLFALLLAGDFAWSMRDRSVGPMAQWYLHHLGVPNLVFGLLISSFPALIGLILGPIISVKSDRHRGKWGRRIPFLLVTTPIAAFGMIGLAVTPLIAEALLKGFPNQHPMIVALACFAIFWAAFEFATIAGQAVFGGLINDVVPKEMLGRFYGLFRAVSLIDGMIFNFWIMGMVPTHFTVILLAIGIFYGTAFMLVCLRVKEGNYPPPALAGEPERRGFFKEVETYFQQCFRNRYYVLVYLMLTLAFLSFIPINTFSIPYAKSLNIDMTIYGKYLALTYLISLSLSFFIGWLADAFHPLRIALFMLALYVLVTLWAGFHAVTESSFLLAWVMHGVLSGCYMTSAASLGQRLFPHARFAQFASAAAMLLAVGSMIMAPIVGALIDHSGGIYRYAFTIGCSLAACALVMGYFVHRRFTELGGSRSYVAPE